MQEQSSTLHQQFTPSPAKAIAQLELSPYADHMMRLAATVAAICGGLYGYDTGIIAGALILITKEFQLQGTMQEFVAAAILAGAVAGALATGTMSEAIGRRRSVMVITIVYIIGALACAAAPDVWSLIAARFFLGLAVGGSTQVVPMYISELAPAERRGKLVTLFNVAIGIGILLANIVGFTLHESWSWRAMVAVAAVPALIVFISMFFLPQSPRWAAENIGLHGALDALRQVRNCRHAIHNEVKQIQETAQKTRDEDRGWRGLGQSWVRPALVAALGVAFFTQCGGLEMMIYYAPTFLSQAGFGASSALLASLGVAIVYCLMTLIGCLNVDRIGRRRLMLIMCPGSVLSLIGLGTVFALNPQPGGLGSWLIVAFLLLFILFNAGGIQVVGWLLGAEMFPLSMRSQATSLHAATLWGSNLIVTGTALSLVHVLTLGGTMWFYAGVNIVSFLFVLYFVPETAGSSLEDIEAALKEKRFRPDRERIGILQNA
ncbi:sugar porter family MFS transporter [Beijerinckia indica]|uniref:Sugar transporter n=1 Tax=Beijerinckia indica subsp. indica (strain ATCC 9039 / DSM 1715 / NCIMB 8712) TaxID=395963 RepID=B2IHU3_BEII9|nr:sugar porter family MFS transporter [Beijerinckia indica]ACB95986.1 sugar transporter [Beijerinckia indica subsp. indica ATCC 9039]